MVNSFGSGRDKVINGIATEFISQAKTANLQNAWIRGFDDLFREFDLGHPISGGRTNGGKLINATEGGLIVGGHELCADPQTFILEP